MQIEDIQAINRSVITIVPREPFFAWINSLDPENPMTPQNFPERTACLIESTDNRESAIIFKSELNGMWTDENDSRDGPDRAIGMRPALRSIVRLFSIASNCIAAGRARQELYNVRRYACPDRLESGLSSFGIRAYRNLHRKIFSVGFQ